MTEIKWEALEYEQHERSAWWYYLLFAAAVFFILIALWQKNFLFAVFIILVTAVSVHWSYEKPPHHIISITRNAINIGYIKSWRYDELMGFAMQEGRQNDSEWGTLVLRSKNWFYPHIHILMPLSKTGEVREFLHIYLHEFKHEDSLTDELLRWFRM